MATLGEVRALKKQASTFQATQGSLIEKLVSCAVNSLAQEERGLVDTSNTLEMEIQASEKLIRNRRPYQISNQETRETIQRLRELRQAAADKQE